MANPSWNPADKTAGMTLSGSNLIATTTTAPAWVRTVDSKASGKFYYEITATVSTSTSTGQGIVSLAANMINGVNGSGACGFTQNGLVFADGNFSGTIIGSIASGTVVCTAIDLTARLIWFRLGAAGQWNNSGTPNPATGVGGIAFTTIGNGIQTYPAFFGSLNAEAVSANFGDSTFVGAVPSGFTAGFPPAGGGAAAAQALVMVLA